MAEGVGRGGYSGLSIEYTTLLKSLWVSFWVKGVVGIFYLRDDFIEILIVPFNTLVKYLGVTFDQTLSFHDQITNVCRSVFIEMRRIASVRRCLSITTCSQLVSALITSRLDYCNSIYAGLSNEELARLQRVQNCAARLVLCKKKRDHVTPLLRELHWLPVIYRISTKLQLWHTAILMVHSHPIFHTRSQHIGP